MQSGPKGATPSAPAPEQAGGGPSRPEKAKEAAASSRPPVKAERVKPEGGAEKEVSSTAEQKQPAAKNASKAAHSTAARNLTAAKGGPHKEAKTKTAEGAAKPPAVTAKTSAKEGAAGSYYALQIGAYKEKKHAEIERVRLEARGYKAQIRSTDIGSPKGVLHRVYLGHFKTPEEAKTFAKTLHKKDGIESYMVMIKE